MYAVLEGGHPHNHLLTPTLPPAHAHTTTTCMCSSQVAQRVYVVQDARVQLLEGGVEEYVQRLQGQGKKQGKGSALSLRQQAREKKKKAAAGDGEGTGV